MATRYKNNVNGWLNINKPAGISSAAVVGRIRWLLGAKKCGHAGTLDPLADGVLPIALGEATKTIPFMMDAKKAYSFEVKWGEETDTLDAEGEIIGTNDKTPRPEEITAILPEFTGKIMQIPPKFSALKVDGKRAYELARAGQEVELKSREIEIFDLKYSSPRFYAECSKGTYIRSLARDIAYKTSSLAYITLLRREKVGKFDIKSAISLDYLEKIMHSAPLSDIMNVSGNLLPVSTVLDDILAVEVDIEAEAKLKNGVKIPIDSPDENQASIYSQGGVLIALGEIKQGVFAPKRVFNL